MKQLVSSFYNFTGFHYIGDFSRSGQLHMFLIFKMCNCLWTTCLPVKHNKEHVAQRCPFLLCLLQDREHILELAQLTGSCFSLHLFFFPEALQELLLQLLSDMNWDFLKTHTGLQASCILWPCFLQKVRYCIYDFEVAELLSLWSMLQRLVTSDLFDFTFCTSITIPIAFDDKDLLNHLHLKKGSDLTIFSTHFASP